MREIIDRLWRFKKISEQEKISSIREARAFFGGVSGESKELEEEFERGTSEEESDDIDFGDDSRRAPVQSPRVKSLAPATAPVAVPQDSDSNSNDTAVSNLPAPEESASPSSDEQESQSE